MARIGTVRPQARIYDYARKEYQPEYDMSKPVNDQSAPQRYTDKIIAPQKVIFSPYVDFDVKLGSMKEEQKEFIKRRKDVVSGLNYEKIGKPKSEYHMKIGSRSEGNFYDQALSKPYVEMGPHITGLHGDIFQQAPALNMMSEDEAYRLTTVYNPDMIKPISKSEKKIEQVAKLQKLDGRQKIIMANQNTRDFMESGLGKILVYPSTDTSMGDNGSNIKFNYAKETNMGTEPKTAKQLYEETFLNKKSVSGVNTMQRDAEKARQFLGLFGNRQHLAIDNSQDIRLTDRMISPHKYMKHISMKPQ
jgi:hypothetical protein